MALRFGFILALVALYIAGSLMNAHHAETWVLASLMGVVFLALVAAMYMRVIPALLALPILAIALASIAGMKWDAILTTVVQEGSMRLSIWIIAAIFGSILAQVVEKTGIAQTAIKKTAELGGDRPMILAVLLTIVIALLFTTLGGLGAVIMVATIVIPILLSLGLRPLYVGCLFLLAMSLGGAFNLVNWQFYMTELKLTQSQIIVFALPFAVLMLIVTFAFLAIEGKRMGKARYKAEVTETETTHQFVPWYALLTPIVPLVPVLVFALLPKVWHVPAEITVTNTVVSEYKVGGVTMVSDKKYGPLDLLPHEATHTPGVTVSEDPNFKYNQMPFIVPILTGNTIQLKQFGTYTIEPAIDSDAENKVKVEPLKYEVKPWTKVILHVGEDQATGSLTITTEEASTTYDFPIIVALLLGIIYGAITTWRKGTSTVQLVTKASFDGVAAVGPAVVLMIGIGMVLKATMAPEVSGIITPILKGVVPGAAGVGGMLHYVILFAVLAPLALYRGPLNLYGMGAGLIGALNGLMPSGAIMGAFMSVGMIQGVSDPTNTHNVWIANYTNTDVQDILKRTLPYMWALALVGLLLSAILYYGGVVR
jgi:hypothetical protein